MRYNFLSVILKGICIGGTMLVPGVSGGSMAMILGIYDKLIYAVGSITKDKKQKLIFLIVFSLSALLGMVFFAKPLLNLIETYPNTMMYFFIGLVAGGIPVIYKKAQVKKITFKAIGYILLGVTIVILFSKLPANFFSGSTNSAALNIIILMITGFAMAIALILPGISVSYVLLLMGLYERTVVAISEFQLDFLGPVAIGGVMGILMTTKFLENVMEKRPYETYLIILGFVLGSVIQVFPGIPYFHDLVTCIILMVMGFKIIKVIS